MVELTLDFVETTSCEHPIAAMIGIKHDIPTIPATAQFRLEANIAASHDLLQLEDVTHYMSYGIYMSYELFMSNFDIDMVTTETDITALIRAGEDFLYQIVDNSILDGTNSLLYRLVYTLDGLTWETTDFVLGYKSVPIQPLGGLKKLCHVPERQLFRGKHDSTKYNRQLKSIEADIRMSAMSSDGIRIEPYTAVHRLVHLANLARM